MKSPVNAQQTATVRRHTIATLFFLFICRLVAMLFIPLNDTTEARYAEIARKMLETGDWITPMHDYGVPFWAKPPLSFWLSAISMKYLGVNEFAARLPSLCLSLAVLWLIYMTAKKQSGPAVALIATLVLASSFAFLLNAGAVMTDPSLLFCTTLTMVAFWRAVSEKDQRWSYVFFIGLGLGLLAKGPLILVLTGIPIFTWVLFYQKWRALWEHLPWIKGSVIMLLIALPWYLLAEYRTPGFLNYFIVGEHLGRFLQHGWQGDKYGGAHSAHLGMIWVYALIGIFPWTIGVMVWLAHHGKKIPSFCRETNGWVSYWLLSALIPLLFFTCAKNIIWPYILPSMPAFALLCAEFYSQTALSTLFKKTYVFVAATSGMVLLVATALFVLEPQYLSRSQKPVIALWKNQHPSANSHLVYWTHRASAYFSGQFYSSGRINMTADQEKLLGLLSNNMENSLVVNVKEPILLPTSPLLHLNLIKTIQTGEGTFTLYRTAKIAPDAKK